MSARIGVVLGVGVLVSPAIAAEPSNFNAMTTLDLVALCADQPDDPLYAEAKQFCYGFLAGVAQFHRAMVHGEKIEPIACPAGAVSREQLVGARGDKHDHRRVGRLLERLEQLVRGLRVEPFGIEDEDHLARAFHRAPVRLVDDGLRILNADLIGARVDLDNVGMRAATRQLERARVAVRRDDHRRERPRRLLDPGSPRAHEEIGMAGALGGMLFISSLVAANYNRAVRIFLIGLGIVAVGVAAAILGEVLGYGHNILGG